MNEVDSAVLDDSVRYVYIMDGDELVVYFPTIHDANGLIDEGTELVRINRSDERFPWFFERYRQQQMRLNAYVRDRRGWTITFPDSEG